jgi:quercetin dioxygenase-like cupin family protein
VRVWEVLLEPGQVQDWHLHDHPYLVLAVEEAHNVMEYLDGGEARRMHETVGRVVYREAGRVHKLTNAGETTYRNRLIELKHLAREDDGV